MIRREHHADKGQGLVEYALVLVLVAVVVMAALTLLGPQIGNVFSTVVAGLGGSTGAAVAAPGKPTITMAQFQLRDGNRVVIQVEVSEPTMITVSDKQGGSPVTANCNNGCTPDIFVGGPSSGTLIVTAPGNSKSVFYPAPP